MHIFAIPPESSIGQEEGQKVRTVLDAILHIRECLDKPVVFGTALLSNQGMRTCSEEELGRDVKSQPQEQILQVDSRAIPRYSVEQMLEVQLEQIPVSDLRAYEAGSQHITRMLPLGTICCKDTVTQNWPQALLPLLTNAVGFEVSSQDRFDIVGFHGGQDG